MKKNKIVFTLLLVALLAISLITINSNKILAQSSNSQSIAYKIGDSIVDFNLINVDGSTKSLSAMNANGAILIFTSNNCPYTKAYENRIIELDKKYKSLGYPVVAINSNSVGLAGEDGMDENKIYVNEKGFTFPYLKDETQEIANAFGVKRTPTAFVLKRENGKYILKYTGAIDDNSQSATDATKKYIELAIGELLLGKTISINTTKSVGCGVKWKSM